MHVKAPSTALGTAASTERMRPVVTRIDLFFIRKGFPPICHGCINGTSNEDLDTEVCSSFILNSKIIKAAGKSLPELELL